VGPSARGAARTTKPGLPKASARPAPLHLTNHINHRARAHACSSSVSSSVRERVRAHQRSTIIRVLHSTVQFELVLSWCYCTVSVINLLASLAPRLPRCDLCSPLFTILRANFEERPQRARRAPPVPALHLRAAPYVHLRWCRRLARQLIRNVQYCQCI
jgi:hypothetical protein